ncbi:flavodoxin-dependent (E)-4-hydroxy-3-methylbut-2-enyl-diphosphate synthase [candidate division CSSED10-310 bacterium]|uniref:4-hydroxy-3-methylbut-2-en-1-yl diphosphate synthase (flavodoxin) n=1 Tax=candidate division CSSED10-310 bacterium TaxID=2855610 RepID=A0ABV6YVQ5_UNCC1
MFVYTRNETKPIRLGNVVLGGGNPIRVQSMLKVPLTAEKRALQQAQKLESVGCEILRFAVPDKNSLPYINSLVASVSIPTIADIHFDYRLAVAAIEKGVAGLRINPGNIGSTDRIRTVVEAAKAHQIPIRIGVNAGSLDKEILKKFKEPNAEAMVSSAFKHIRLLEQFHFDQIKISLKASSVTTTIEAYKRLASIVDYPLHLGITEAGPPGIGTARSAVGLGILLHEGLGDTIRVSLTGPPEEEVKIGFEILKALGLRSHGPTLISCPTCGRCQIDILPLVREVENILAAVSADLSVAVMGCVVNGPGEAREADIGIAGGKNNGLLFIKGKPIGKYPPSELLPMLLKAINDLNKE